MKFIVFLLFCFLEILGYRYIYRYSFNHFFLYNIFIGLNSLIILYFLKVVNVKKNIIYIHTFMGWLIYISLGFIHAAYIAKLDSNSETFTTIYILFIVASLLLFLPIIYLKKNFLFSGFSSLESTIVHNRTILFFVIVCVVFKIYEIYVAGGLINYIFASYGAKVESSFMTFFHLFEGIANNVVVFVFYILWNKNPKSLKFLCVLFFIYSMIMGAIGGSSTSVLTPIIGIFVFAILASNNLKMRKKLKRYAIIGVALGVFIGILIRLNRQDNETFSFDGLGLAFDEIMESPTFDNVTNLSIILEKVPPTYSMDQFIYPYIHFIPRTLFPWKPMELGRIIGYKYVGVTEDSMAAFIPSPIGDFYFDYGYIGIVLGMLFVSCFITYIQEKLNASSIQPLFKLVLLIGFATKMLSFAGWYTGCFNSIVKMFIFIVLFLLVNKTVCKRIQFRKSYY